ncbi:MAG: hypothetical protein H6707_09100 [Deltaproteobacteria bacterium]|nr:hypothetical protein [Deltaproteobacteria bacterium]
MNRALQLGVLCACAVGILAWTQSASAVTEVSAVTQVQAGAPVAPIAAAELDALKSCTHNSDCSHGGCSSGRCGSCTHNSDCKGWGGCKGGRCGACTGSGDCKGFGSCNSGRCEKSPY